MASLRAAELTPEQSLRISGNGRAMHTSEAPLGEFSTGLNI